MRCPSCAAHTGLLVLILFSGCSRLSTEYGKTKGVSGRVSLNGFGALRRTFELAGFKSRDVTRLTNRVRRSDTIVWTPQLLGPIDTAVTNWFDGWLAQGNKSLVYIIPDSGSEADYWSQTVRVAPPVQRLEYRKRAARSVNQRIVWRLNREAVTNCGWFDIHALPQRVELDQLAGPWAAGWQAVDASDVTPINVEVTIHEASAAAGKANPIAAGIGNFKPTGPAPATFPYPYDAKASKTEVIINPKLGSEAGTIVAEITSDQWQDSRILVVSGGSLLTNYAFANASTSQLANKLVTAATPTSVAEPQAAFVTSRWSMLPVSDRNPSVPRATGMEILTVWPISLVTMHGVMLALVVGLALLPIFGRPKRIERNHQNDFGDHLDAIAALMNKTGGEEFARGRIREYRRRIHGETYPASAEPPSMIEETT